MLPAPFQGHPLQKRTEVQWDMRAWLHADGGANESMSPQLGISVEFFDLATMRRNKGRKILLAPHKPCHRSNNIVFSCSIRAVFENERTVQFVEGGPIFTRENSCRAVGAVLESRRTFFVWRHWASAVNFRFRFGTLQTITLFHSFTPLCAPLLSFPFVIRRASLTAWRTSTPLNLFLQAATRKFPVRF